MKRAKSRRHRNRGHKPVRGGLSLNQIDHLRGPSTPVSARQGKPQPKPKEP